MVKTYKSKIGRLSYDTRHKLCVMLSDGYSQKQCIDFLNSLEEAKGVVFNNVNITDWTQTGYQDWCQDRERTNHLARLADTSMAIMERTGGDPAAVGSRIIAGKLLDIMEGVEDVNILPELVKSMVALRSAETNAKKAELTAEANALKSRSIELDEQKFRRDTCELFQKWYDRPEIKTLLADNAVDSDAKTEALGQLLFGDLWKK